MGTPFSFDRLVEYLESEELEPYKNEEEQAVECAIPGDNGIFSVAFDLNVVEGYLSCGVRPPIEIQHEHLGRILEATARANFLLPMGGFQVNIEEPDVMFVLGVPIEGGDLSTTQLEDILGFSLECADLYTPAFQEILEGADVAEAIARAEEPVEGEV